MKDFVLIEKENESLKLLVEHYKFIIEQQEYLIKELCKEINKLHQERGE